MNIAPCEATPGGAGESGQREAPLTLAEKLLGALGAVSLAAGVVVVSLFVGGCRAFYENAGSRTVVGSVTAPVDISDASDNVAAKLLYSMDGASVYTAKDSLVKIHYANIYTNTYFGIVGTRGNQDLTVEIEPLEVGGDVTVGEDFNTNLTNRTNQTN